MTGIVGNTLPNHHQVVLNHPFRSSEGDSVSLSGVKSSRRGAKDLAGRQVLHVLAAGDAAPAAATGCSVCVVVEAAPARSLCLSG